MADENDTEGTTDENAQQGAEDQQQGDPADLGDAGKKALDAERKRASEAEKSAKALQAQLDQLNDAKLTETQRLQKQLDQLTEAHKATQLAAARDRVAVAEQLPPALVPYLAGDSEEDFTASAQALKAALAEAAKPGTPKPDPSQGAHGTPADSPASAFARFVENALT